MKSKPGWFPQPTCRVVLRSILIGITPFFPLERSQGHHLHLFQRAQGVPPLSARLDAVDCQGETSGRACELYQEFAALPNLIPEANAQ
jgi:hypothetical protein